MGETIRDITQVKKGDKIRLQLNPSGSSPRWNTLNHSIDAGPGGRWITAEVVEVNFGDQSFRADCRPETISKGWIFQLRRISSGPSDGWPQLIEESQVIVKRDQINKGDGVLIEITGEGAPRWGNSNGMREGTSPRTYMTGTISGVESRHYKVDLDHEVHSGIGFVKRWSFPLPGSTYFPKGDKTGLPELVSGKKTTQPIRLEKCIYATAQPIEGLEVESWDARHYDAPPSVLQQEAADRVIMLAKRRIQTPVCPIQNELVSFTAIHSKEPVHNKTGGSSLAGTATPALICEKCSKGE